MCRSTATDSRHPFAEDRRYCSPVDGPHHTFEPRLVLLTGASSVGKTSAGRALQSVTELPAIFIPGDDLDLPRHARSLERLRELPPHEANRLEAELDSAYLHGLNSFVQHGFHAIGELIFKEPARTATCLRVLTEIPHLLVLLQCDADVRRTRERLRNDRPLGLSDKTSDTARPSNVRFDLELDTSELTPQAVAEAIRRVLETETAAP